MIASAPPSDRPDSAGFADEALWGVWWLDARASSGDPRVARLTFFRDHRFGARSPEGASRVYGGWTLRASARESRSSTSELIAANLALYFDNDAAPSIEYGVSFPNAPLGPLLLHEGDRTRLVFRRAPPLEATLVGRWRAVTTAATAAALELGLDASYTLRPARGAARTGAWSFERDDATTTRGAIAGTLVLEPHEAARHVERWAVRLSPGPSRAFVLADGTQWRAAVDAAAGPLVGRWRRVSPRSGPAPDELVFRGDGALEVLARPGVPRAPGQWTFERGDLAPDALQGRMRLTVQPPGAARAVRDRWHVRLAFARGAELEIAGEGSGQMLRYRRFFR